MSMAWTCKGHSVSNLSNWRLSTPNAINSMKANWGSIFVQILRNILNASTQRNSVLFSPICFFNCLKQLRTFIWTWIKICLLKSVWILSLFPSFSFCCIHYLLRFYLTFFGVESGSGNYKFTKSCSVLKEIVLEKMKTRLHLIRDYTKNNQTLSLSCILLLSSIIFLLKRFKLFILTRKG